jgi:alkylated DNA repair dioxygenase AlkB
MAPAAPAAIEDAIARTLKALDLDAVRRTYRDQDEFVYIDRLFPEDVIGPMVEEVERAKPRLNRNYIPRHKKGGSVSYYTLREQAPGIMALYQSASFLQFVRDVTGAAANPCPESDPHACALYYYTEPGDHIGFHYDTSYYKGTRYTVLLGLVER